MNISEASAQLREASGDYSSQWLTLAEYRAKRKDLLDEIDKVFNGQSVAITDTTRKEVEPIKTVDATDEVFTDISRDVEDLPTDLFEDLNDETH